MQLLLSCIYLINLNQGLLILVFMYLFFLENHKKMLKGLHEWKHICHAVLVG